MTKFQKKCNKLAIEIWEWCIDRNIWLKCSHIPGKDYIKADRLSREFNEQVEWQFDHDIFLQICSKFGKPDTDLFASRFNSQPKYFDLGDKIPIAVTYVCRCISIELGEI